MNTIRIIGVLLLAAALVSGFILQSRWHALVSQRRADTVSSSTTTEADGTVVHMTAAVGHGAEIRWRIILPLLAAVAGGIACLCASARRVT